MTFSIPFDFVTVSRRANWTSMKEPEGTRALESQLYQLGRTEQKKNPGTSLIMGGAGLRVDLL